MFANKKWAKVYKQQAEKKKLYLLPKASKKRKIW